MASQNETQGFLARQRKSIRRSFNTTLKKLRRQFKRPIVYMFYRYYFATIHQHIIMSCTCDGDEEYEDTSEFSTGADTVKSGSLYRTSGYSYEIRFPTMDAGLDRIHLAATENSNQSTPKN